MNHPDTLTTTEKAVTLFAILAGLIFFGLALTQCQVGSFFVKQSAPQTLPLTAEPPEVVSTDALSAPVISEKKAAVLAPSWMTLQAEEQATRLRTLTTELETERKNHALLRRDFKKLATRLETQSTPPPASPPTIDKASAPFAEPAPQPGQLEAQNATLKADLQALQQERTALAARLITLEKQESSPPFDRAALEERWQKKFDALQQQLKETSQSDAEKIKALTLALRRAKTQRSFAETSQDLAPSAQQLIEKLEQYQAVNPGELETLYQNDLRPLGASRKLVVQYDSGSARLSAEAQERLTKLTSEAGAQSYFVAIGYADQSGSAAQNKTLSSQRATRAVEHLKTTLSEDQFAQAYYLGQTARFGPPARNRIVEIWEIQAPQN